MERKLVVRFIVLSKVTAQQSEFLWFEGIRKKGWVSEDSMEWFNEGDSHSTVIFPWSVIVSAMSSQEVRKASSQTLLASIAMLA